MLIADGFPGQRMRVLPRPLVSKALATPPTSALLVTDCGYFPRAAHHGRTRERGLLSAIVMVCTEGAGWVEFASGRHRLGAHEVLIIPQRTPHAYHADEDDPWSIWWMHVAGDAVPSLVDAAIPDGAESPIVPVRDAYRLATLVEEVVGRTEHDETAASLIAAAGPAWHLLAVLPAERAASTTRTDPIEAALEYLRAHIGTRVPVADLARQARLSPSHFAALFRARTGFGVLRYQTSLRMARARELLDTTDRSVASVAGLVGYADAFYFSRQFASVHGVSPRDYRNRDRTAGDRGEPATRNAGRAPAVP